MNEMEVESDEINDFAEGSLALGATQALEDQAENSLDEENADADSTEENPLRESETGASMSEAAPDGASGMENASAETEAPRREPPPLWMRLPARLLNVWGKRVVSRDPDLSERTMRLLMKVHPPKGGGESVLFWGLGRE